MQKYYEIDLFYSLDYIQDDPIIYNDKYLVILNNSKKEKAKEEDEEKNKSKIEPNVIIYRFEDEGETTLFAALYETDIDGNPFNDSRIESFEIVDSALNIEEDGNTYLYLILLTDTFKKKKPVRNKLTMKKFLLGEYKMEYNLKSYRFRDTVEFVALDFYQNKIAFKLEAVILSNRDLYVFLFITSGSLIIVFILIFIVVYKYWEYKKLKRNVDARVANDIDQVDEDSANDLMSGLESHFQNQDQSDSN